MNDDADIQKALDAVVLYRVDSEKGDGKDLAKEFKIGAYPTFIVANKDGNMADLWLGYSKDYFIETLAQSLKDLRSIDDKKAGFDSKPDLNAALTLGRYYSAAGEPKEAVEYYLHAQVLKTDSTADYSYEIFDNTAAGFKKKLFSYDDVGRAAEISLTSKVIDPQLRVEVAREAAAIATKEHHPDDIPRFLQAGLDATAGGNSPEAKRANSELMVDFSLMVKHDTATAVEYRRASMPDGWLENASDLNSFAWWCFENHANLVEAEKLSQKSVDIAKPGKEKAMNLDTLAEIKHALGNTAEAILLSKKAAKEDPSSDYYPKQVEKFTKALENKK